MSKLLEQMKPLVNQTIDKLDKKEFQPDPIEQKLTKTVSVISSAYKRHGFIIEQTLLAHMKSNPNLECWEEKKFFVPKAVSHAVQSQLEDVEELFKMDHEYIPEIKVKEKKPKKIQVDLFVYNKKLKTLYSYEVKRGNGHHDSGKQKSILRDLLHTRALLKSYGQQKGLQVNKVKSWIYFHYGIGTLGKEGDKIFKISGREIDDHFGFSIYDEIEEVNNYFSKRLFLIEAVQGKILKDLLR